MTKLSDTQALILSAAAQRPEHIALPLPESLRGGAAAKVVGAMLAKGMVVGAQFEALFEDGLYFVLATHANAMAARLREILQRAGVPLAVDSPSNQVFPVLPDAVVERLRSFVEFETWERRGDGTTVIRLMTSWATPESDIEAFAATFAALYTEGRTVGAAQQAQGA